MRFGTRHVPVIRVENGRNRVAIIAVVLLNRSRGEARLWIDQQEVDA
jgi:hypothetical protein